MALTRDFKETVLARVDRDPVFAKELLDEATTLLICGEADTARVIQWRYLEPQYCDSYEHALTLAENWLYSRLG